MKEQAKSIQNKYSLVNVSFFWARELRRKKGNKVILSDLVQTALDDVINKKITIDNVESIIESEREKK